jgi:dTDP-4-amino-4,6-dideoxy-D-galactose acyltransferase
MITTATRLATARPVLRYLVWDSNHFGFPVAQIVEPRLSERELASALRQARRQETQLVYWSCPPEQTVPVALLHEFGGLLADRKVTYQKALAAHSAAEGGVLLWEGEAPAEPAVAARPEPRPPTRGHYPAAPGGLTPELMIRPYPQGPASPALVELALAAGVHSRFRVDRRIPAGRFTGLFQTWIQRSTRHELADAVLVAAPSDRPEEILAMVTLSETGGTGHIDLVAVAEAARGRGLGLQMLQAAESWMLGRGAKMAQVVSQRANRPACGLYQRAGYHVLDVKHVYHFWTQEADPAAG